METKLPESITTIEEAKEHLRSLYINGEEYHPEDNAATLVGNLFTYDEAMQLNKLMQDINALPDFDPCEFLLSLDEENMLNDRQPDGTPKYIADGDYSERWAVEDIIAANTDDDGECDITLDGIELLKNLQVGEDLNIGMLKFTRIS